MMLEGDIDRMPPEQRQKFYRSVWEKTKKLKFIVHDILNATSFANQKFSVVEETAETIDVPAMLGKIIGDFDMEVKERGIDLELRAYPSQHSMLGWIIPHIQAKFQALTFFMSGCIIKSW
jgi:signal transduction histidine kinase